MPTKMMVSLFLVEIICSVQPQKLNLIPSILFFDEDDEDDDIPPIHQQKEIVDSDGDTLPGLPSAREDDDAMNNDDTFAM
mmetsp:Transcript_8169/g.11381  ORF Transcript_8169/g.11381 Transcript_8169/m.11381 type:complete len:80 (+) Transcript_8169:1582-1821(+)